MAKQAIPRQNFAIQYDRGRIKTVLMKNLMYRSFRQRKPKAGRHPQKQFQYEKQAIDIYEVFDCFRYRAIFVRPAPLPVKPYCFLFFSIYISTTVG